MLTACTVPDCIQPSSFPNISTGKPVCIQHVTYVEEPKQMNPSVYSLRSTEDVLVRWAELVCYVKSEPQLLEQHCTHLSAWITSKGNASAAVKEERGNEMLRRAIAAARAAGVIAINGQASSMSVKNAYMEAMRQIYNLISEVALESNSDPYMTNLRILEIASDFRTACAAQIRCILLGNGNNAADSAIQLMKKVSQRIETEMFA